MRRIATFWAVTAVFVGVMAAPAVADDPVHFVEDVSFDALNPCTGEVHTVNITFSVFEHFHGDEFVARVRRTGTTSDGYDLVKGREVFKADPTGVWGWFRDVWSNPDGGAFFAMGAFEMRGDDVLMDEFRIRCIG